MSQPRDISRRTFLLSGAGFTVGAYVIGIPSAAASDTSTSLTMWRLDPAWGYPLTTASGSATKSRCKANACHAAAPHRFFLTADEAIAGRLHPCCLAQPTPVVVCLRHDELMPFYTARLGGVDARCPDLPASIRTALTAGACVEPASGGPTTTTAPTPPASSAPTTTPSDTERIALEQAELERRAAGLQAQRRRASSTPPDQLALTGSDPSRLLVAAAGALVAGTVAARMGRPDDPEPERFTPPADQPAE